MATQEDAKERRDSHLAFGIGCGIGFVVPYDFAKFTQGHLEPRSIVGSLVVATLIARSIFIIAPAKITPRIALAFLPLGAALVADFLIPVQFSKPAEYGSLDSFFVGTAGLLGVLLIPVVIESRRLADDPWFRAVRDWWVFFIVLGIAAALSGLTPAQSVQEKDVAYTAVWTGVVGALTGLTVIMWADRPTTKR